MSQSLLRLNLLTQPSLSTYKEKNYKYIHIELVQEVMKSLTKESLNTSILTVLSDAQFYNFQDLLLNFF